MLAIAASSAFACATDYGQCGGDGWDGQRCCAGNECQEKDEYYSQCIPIPKAAAVAAAQRPVVTSINSILPAITVTGSRRRPRSSRPRLGVTT